MAKPLILISMFFGVLGGMALIMGAIGINVNPDYESAGRDFIKFGGISLLAAFGWLCLAFAVQYFTAKFYQKSIN